MNLSTIFEELENLCKLDLTEEVKARAKFLLIEFSKIDYSSLESARMEILFIRGGFLSQEDYFAEMRKNRNGDKPVALPVPASEDLFNEDLAALEFTAKYGDSWKYVSAWGQWLKWTGQKWEKESTLHVFDLARGICREMAEKPKEKSKRPILKSAVVAAVERLTRADRVHAARSDQWDKEKWSLNTPAGILDLKIGNIRPCHKEAYCMKITACAPSDEGGQKWYAFVDFITGGDKELAKFLQRICGYALTGVTYEQALFFLYGTGSNGKTQFLDAISTVLNDYAVDSPAATFLSSDIERHPTELAALRGARLVTATEIGKNKRWNEPRIKSLTGGDRITARFMRQDNFEFKPEFKLFISGNNKPHIIDVDEAIRRRLFLIPFAVKVKPTERIMDYGRILAQEEGPAILYWMVSGCMEWQKEGLNSPPVVVNSTNEYLDSEDVMGKWIMENCVENKRSTCFSNTLYANWKEWTEKNKEYTGSNKEFAQTLDKKGFKKHHKREGEMFFGISLKGMEIQSEFNS